VIDLGGSNTVFWEALLSIDFAAVFVVLLMGAGLSLFYFCGLWLTVKRLPKSQHPASLTVASFLIRTGVVLLGFYYIMEGRLERLLAAMAGFLIVRLILVRLIGPVQSRLSKA
jgi:F1F0 ATPase subunit 2